MSFHACPLAKGKLDGSQPKYCNLCHQGRKQSLQGLCQEIGIPALFAVVLGTFKRKESGASFGNCHLISLFTHHKVSPESYHTTNSPQQNATYSFTHVGNLPTPMTHGKHANSPVVWGLDHPDTLTFEHNLAAPRLGPETWGGWGQDPQMFPTWKMTFFFIFQTLARCFFSSIFL